MIEHTYIEFLGLTLTDPLTFVSDVMMALVLFYCGHKIFYAHTVKYAKYVGMFFLLLGISALIGGTSHLLFHYFGKAPHLVAWSIQGVSILFIELASIKTIQNERLANFLKMAIYVFFGAYISQLFFIQEFTVVKFNSSIGLIGFAAFIHLVNYFVRKEREFINVPLAIALLLIPALTHSLGIQANAWFNQNVISHLILLPCYFVLYKGFNSVAKSLATSKTLQAPQ